MKNNKHKNYLLIVIFGILIITAFFMPDISDYFDNLKNSKKINEPLPNNSKKSSDLTPKYVNSLSDISDKLSLSIDNYIVNNIVISNEHILFNITSNIPRSKALSEELLFLELYNATNKFIGRLFISSAKIFEDGETMNLAYQYGLGINEVTKVSLVKKTINDYPSLLTKQEDFTLVCTKGNENFKYIFKTQKLEIMYKNIFLPISSKNYIELKNKLQDEATSLDLLDGINTSFLEDLTGSKLTVKYDSMFSINKENGLYNKDTVAKKIKFEMESLLYTCVVEE